MTDTHLAQSIAQLGDMIRTIRDQAEGVENYNHRALLDEIQASLYEAYHLMLRVEAKAHQSQEIKRTIAKHFGA